ncbi:MAG: hypothetical protein JWP03_739 [Phycisphaerales bacterium]|nr:hypothetical protein [Phycisphaerales bacterium]
MAKAAPPKMRGPVHPPRPVQERINDKFREALLRVNHRSSALLLWERLSDEERRGLLAAAHAAGARPSRGGDEEAAAEHPLWACFRHFRGTVAMWMHLRQVSQRKAVIQLARELGVMSDVDCRWLDRQTATTDPAARAPTRPVTHPDCDEEGLDEQIDRARLEKDLVLVQGNGVRQIYWEGELVPAAWDRCPLLWELLSQLVQRAKTRREVSWDLLSNGRNEKSIVQLRWRLKRVIPPGLNKAIRPGSGAGRYRLDLDPGRIALFELTGDDWLAGPVNI